MFIFDKSWVMRSFVSICFFSFPSLSTDGEAELYVYHLVAVPQKTIFIASYDDRTPKQHSWKLILLDMWRRREMPTHRQDGGKNSFI